MIIKKKIMSAFVSKTENTLSGILDVTWKQAAAGLAVGYFGASWTAERQSIFSYQRYHIDAVDSAILGAGIAIALTSPRLSTFGWSVAGGVAYNKYCMANAGSMMCGAAKVKEAAREKSAAAPV